MTQAKAFDTSSITSSPFLQQMKKEGATTAIRYYRTTPSAATGALTVPELLTLLSEGFAVVPVFEVENLKPNINQFTYETGKQHGAIAFAHADGVIRQPFNSTIYFAVDFNPGYLKIDDVIIPYFKGVNEAMEARAPADGGYAIGVYGPGLVCRTLRDNKLVTYTWLSNSTSFIGSKDFAAEGEWNLKQHLQQPKGKYLLDVEFSDIGTDGCGSFSHRVVREPKTGRMIPLS